MKKIVFILIAAALNCAAADSVFDPINELGYGTFKLRAQTLSMYRDYEGVGNGYSTTLGWKLDYLTPEWEGLSAGVSYIHVDVLDTAGGTFGDDGEDLLSNGRVNELNELWVKYTMDAVGLTNTFVKVGRQVVNGEVFRSDEFRQKPRALEAVLLTTKDIIPDTTITIGHADRLSNVWGTDSGSDRANWRYKDIENVLGANYDTDGVTWAEFVNTSIDNLEIAMYDAYAHDIANIAGGRFKYTLSDTTAVNGYYRHETDVGKGADRRTDMVGASIQQKVGGVTLEPGFLSVSGDNILFDGVNTGINHPLGSSLMGYTAPLNGGADTYYLKATTKIDKTILYALYHYTTHDKNTAFEGQELDFVAKQLISDNLSVAVKAGVAYRDNDGGADNTTAIDTRLFVTYQF
jgi:hypothetical protein